MAYLLCLRHNVNYTALDHREDLILRINLLYYHSDSLRMLLPIRLLSWSQSTTLQIAVLAAKS